MITKEIAALIFNCYQEIDQAGKMVEELKTRLNDKGQLELKDHWGNVKGLELHIPNPSGSYSIKRLPFDIALTVIERHVESQHKELERLKDVCKIQLK